MIPDFQLIFLPLAKRGLGNKNFLHFLVQFLHLRCFPAFLTLFPASDVIFSIDKKFLHFLAQFLHLRYFPAFLTVFPASDVILPLIIIPAFFMRFPAFHMFSCIYRDAGMVFPAFIEMQERFFLHL